MFLFFSSNCFNHEHESLTMMCECGKQYQQENSDHTNLYSWWIYRYTSCYILSPGCLQHFSRTFSRWIFILSVKLRLWRVSQKQISELLLWIKEIMIVYEYMFVWSLFSYWYCLPHSHFIVRLSQRLIKIKWQSIYSKICKSYLLFIRRIVCLVRVH
jgi:hypothetical protein